MRTKLQTQLASAYTWWDTYFFRQIDAKGFGLMRMGWAAIVLIFMLCRMSDIALVYSNAGFLPDTPRVPGDLGHLVFRSDFRYSILTYLQSPIFVYAIYATLIASSACMLIGLWPRWSTALSVLLLFSFHERNLIPLGGGDTVLRNIGFLLLICPELRACSLERIQQHWHNWKMYRKILPSLTMSIWPWRLAMWQIICIYVTSSWDKMLGTMWWDGTAPAAALHHDHFARWPAGIMNFFGMFSPFISLTTLLWEMSWILLLLPEHRLRAWSRGYITYHALKRFIIASGIFFHGSIFLLMEVGSFSLAMMCFYLGLLVHQDFKVLQNWWNRKFKGHIDVLYDDNCVLCRRSVFVFHLIDWLGRLEYINFHHEAKRKAAVPHIEFTDLDKAMHIKLPNGETPSGFYAMRAISKHIPILWPIMPFLHIPFIEKMGVKTYKKVAARRLKCTDDYCVL